MHESQTKTQIKKDEHRSHIYHSCVCIYVKLLQSNLKENSKTSQFISVFLDIYIFVPAKVILRQFTYLSVLTQILEGPVLQANKW